MYIVIFTEDGRRTQFVKQPFNSPQEAERYAQQNLSQFQYKIITQQEAYAIIRQAQQPSQQRPSYSTPQQSMIPSVRAPMYKPHFVKIKPITFRGTRPPPHQHRSMIQRREELEDEEEEY